MINQHFPEQNHPVLQVNIAHGSHMGIVILFSTIFFPRMFSTGLGGPLAQGSATLSAQEAGAGDDETIAY